jgi:hypothetical protein
MKEKPAKGQDTRQDNDENPENRSRDALEENHATQNKQDIQCGTQIRLLDDQRRRDQSYQHGLAEIYPAKPTFHASHEPGAENKHRYFVNSVG